MHLEEVTGATRFGTINAPPQKLIPTTVSIDAGNGATMQVRLAFIFLTRRIL